MFIKLSNILVKLFVLLLLLPTLSVAYVRKHWFLCNAGISEIPHARIVGGEKADIKDYPFIAAIVVKKGPVDEDSLQCGCTIIAARWVVSAAHCVELLKEESFGVDDIFISAGSKEWRKGNRHTVTHMVAHEKYDADTLNCDISLFHVKNSFNNRYEIAWPLASKLYPYRAKTVVTVLGWGAHSSESIRTQRELEFTKVNIFDQHDCKSMYNAQDEVITRTQFCAGEREGGKDACQFDSGGPLVDDNILIGIISWGIKCAEPGSPGVYTKISLFEQWIVAKSKELHDPIKTDCKPSKRSTVVEHIKRHKSTASYFYTARKLIMLQTLCIFIVL